MSGCPTAINLRWVTSEALLYSLKKRIRDTLSWYFYFCIKKRGMTFSCWRKDVSIPQKIVICNNSRFSIRNKSVVSAFARENWPQRDFPRHKKNANFLILTKYVNEKSERKHANKKAKTAFHYREELLEKFILERKKKAWFKWPVRNFSQKFFTSLHNFKDLNDLY